MTLNPTAELDLAVSALTSTFGAAAFTSTLGGETLVLTVFTFVTFTNPLLGAYTLALKLPATLGAETLALTDALADPLSLLRSAIDISFKLWPPQFQHFILKSKSAFTSILGASTFTFALTGEVLTLTIGACTLTGEVRTSTFGACTLNPKSALALAGSARTSTRGAATSTLEA